MGTTDVGAERPSLGAPLQRVIAELRPVLQRALTRSWPEPPLSPSQARLLRVVRMHPGIAPGDAARELHEDPAFAATLVEQLAALEIVTVQQRRGTATDELRLTPRGCLRAAAWQNKGVEMLDRALETLRPQERASIALALPALEHLAEALADAHLLDQHVTQGWHSSR